jgi:membrane-bound lytic murein transglycosylase D
LVYLLIIQGLFALSIENKYPSYSYVFSEFDIDTSYLYDDAFIAFVNKNEENLKKFYKRSLVRGEEILPMLQGLLIEDGVSDLFIYLSMVESGFSPDIVSPKKAVGLWQFMPRTAKHYNLTVCDAYDERCDVVSSTTAAINYLNKLYRQFGKWYLAAMAYNCGEGCVSKAVKKAGTDDISILTNDRLKYLPKETRDYIRKILLIAMIGESSIIGIGETINEDNGLVEVEVDRGTSIQKIAKLINMDSKSLMKLNGSYKDGVIPKHMDFYKLLIPVEKIYAFYLRYDIPSAKEITLKSHMLTHRVKLGDTLESVSKLYEGDVDEIRVVNHLEYPFLELDTLLVIPVTQKIFEKLSSK